MTARKLDINLLHYKYDLLTKRQIMLAEKYLLDSEKSRTQYGRIDQMMAAPFEHDPPDHLNLVLKKAAEREQSFKEIKSNPFVFFNKNFRLAFATSSLLMIAAIFFIINNTIHKDIMYITSAYGTVTINSSPISTKNYQFDLSKTWDISTYDGKCSIQLNRAKQLALGKNTHIQIKAAQHIDINFIKGSIIGKVIKTADKKKLIFNANGNTFTIVGTVFSIKKKSNLEGADDLEFAVKEGKVKCQSFHKTFSISEGEKINIENHIAVKEQLTTENSKELDTINDINIITNFNNTEKLSIKAFPENSNIFAKNAYLGKSPAFIIIQKNSLNALVLKKDGYADQQLNLNLVLPNKTIILEKKREPITRESPLLIDNFNEQKDSNEIGGETGAFDSNPSETKTYCRAGYLKDNDLHKTGFHLKLTFNVNSKNANVNNGYIMQLNSINLSHFCELRLKIRGDAERGFSKQFKIELKDQDRNSVHTILHGITSDWKTFVIPLNSFETNSDQFDIHNVEKMLFVFNKKEVDAQTGRFYIDDLYFVPCTNVNINYNELFHNN